MKIFGISGLGADERVFKKLTLNYNINTVKWLKPHKKEELKNYIKRLSVEIDDSQPFVLIGVSFGGIVAIELSKILKPEAVIIISSICNDKE
ncbi:MAG: alpha/beta hydrolase, partial [Bacteroidetes bacterium]|nr:alpha/beta hydrolase [Bacteroidota bacterium]